MFPTNFFLAAVMLASCIAPMAAAPQGLTSPRLLSDTEYGAVGHIQKRMLKKSNETPKMPFSLRKSLSGLWQGSNKDRNHFPGTDTPLEEYRFQNSDESRKLLEGFGATLEGDTDQQRPHFLAIIPAKFKVVALSEATMKLHAESSDWRFVKVSELTSLMRTNGDWHIGAV